MSASDLPSQPLPDDRSLEVYAHAPVEMTLKIRNAVFLACEGLSRHELIGKLEAELKMRHQGSRRLLVSPIIEAEQLPHALAELFAAASRDLAARLQRKASQ